MGSKWRGKEVLFNLFFMVCAALTALHIIYHPLRAEYSNLHTSAKNKLYEIGPQSFDKRKANQAAYMEKKRRTNDINFRAMEYHDAQLFESHYSSFWLIVWLYFSCSI